MSIGENESHLEELQNAVVRYVTKETGQKLESIWAYVSTGEHPVVDDAVVALMDTLADEARLKSPVGDDCRAQAELTSAHLDGLLKSIGAVLKLVDQSAGVQFRPGSAFEPPMLKATQRNATRVHSVADHAAQLRAGLPGLIEFLDAFVPSMAKAGFGQSTLPTLYAQKLTQLGHDPALVAEIIGDYDDISPRLPDLARADEQDKRVVALRKRLNRVNAKLQG